MRRLRRGARELTLIIFAFHRNRALHPGGVEKSAQNYASGMRRNGILASFFWPALARSRNCPTFGPVLRIIVFMSEHPLVGIVMGSKSDYEVLLPAIEILRALEIPHEARVLSAHRTPDQLFEYVAAARGRGLRVLIAGAGGAAHLAGVIAAKTLMPVLAVPIAATPLNGWTRCFPWCRCPKGFPWPHWPLASRELRMPRSLPPRFWR